MKPFTLFRAWLLFALVWCCCSSLSTAQIYQNSFLYPGANHDHNSVAEAYTGGNTVQAGTIFASGLNAAHFQEVDDAGNLVWESAKVQANNIPVRAFHIDQDPFNTLAASGTNNYYFGGILEGTAGNTGVLGFVSDGGGMANYLELIAAGWVHTSVLHVSPAETPTPAYLVTGFVAQGFDNTDQKQGFVAMIDQASLTVTWSRFIDSTPLYSHDFDLLSNGIELPGQGFFLSGSVNGFGGQNAYAAKFDYAGNLIWDEGYHYDTAPNGEYNIASSAVHDAAGDRIYQLVNLSETHCFAISAYDASAGALVRLPESMTFINGNYSNTAGYSLHMDPSGGSLTVAGLVRDAVASGFDAEGNPISISGSFPFMLNVNLAGTAINWQHTYPVPSSGYSNSSDIYDSFSAGQQPRVLYPEMAHPKGDGTGYVLNAFRFDALTDPYELEAIETDLLGQNPCEQEPLGISFFTESWISEDVTFIQPGSVDEVSGFLIEIGSTQVEHPCGSIQDPDCQFSMDWDYVLDPDICGQVFFQDLTVAVSGTSLCYTWDFGDGNSSTLASPTHMYAADGVYTVCLTVECCDDPTGASKVQICKDIVIECGTAPCTPNPSFEIVDLDDCCIEIVDLNPSGLSCERWIITGPDGTDNVYTGTSITLCDLTPGTWTICHEDCCLNPDGTFTTLAMCLIWDAQDCGCTPDPSFAIDSTSACCYAFADSSPDPDLDCSTWEIIDTLDGTVIATHSGEFWDYCFTQDGVFLICHTDCCANADGTLTYDTACQTLAVEGCGSCTPDPTFAIDPTSNCCYAFADVTPDTGLNCSSWEIINVTTGALVASHTGEFWDYCFNQDGVYEICHTDCCINPDGTLAYATTCQTLTVEGCECTPDAFFVIDPMADCCYAFADPTPDPNLDCDVWEVYDAAGNLIGSSTGDYYEFCFEQDGTYTVCYTDCCQDATGLLTYETHCEQIVVEGCGCEPYDLVAEPLLSAITFLSCESMTLALSIAPADGYCIDVIFDGVVYTAVYDATQSLFLVTFPTPCPGDYQAQVVIYCCDDPTVAVTTSVELTLDHECCCDVQPELLVANEGCMYTFTLVNNGTTPADELCAYVDVLGGVVPLSDATWTVDFGDNCENGYGVCYDVFCCDSTTAYDPATGSIICVDYLLECCCTPDPAFAVDPIGDCCYAFADLTADPNSDCSTWEIRDTLTGALVTTGNGEFFEFCFTSNGVYEVCHTDCCIHTDGTVHYATSCQSLVVENCGCDLPNADEMGLVLVDSDINCNTWGACVNLPAGSDPTQYCIDWYWGDGTVQTESAAFCPLHTYDCNGAYEVCAHIYCCDDPTNVVVLCGGVEVNCPCTLPQVDFGVTVNDDCTATATLFGIGSEVCPDDICYNWTVIEPGAGVIVTGTGADFTFPGDGTYQICLDVFCCIDSTIGYSLCQLVTVDCPCTLPTDLGLDVVYSGTDCKQIGVCVTGGGSDLCVDYIWGDGTSQSEILDFCPIHTYACSGVYELCAEVYCCDNPDVRVTLCETVVIECPCDLPSNVDFTLLYNDDCTVTPVVALPEDPCDSICYEWFSPHPGVAFDPITGTFSFPGSGAYIVCLNVFCCDGSGLGYTVCQDVQISCPCDLPSSIGFDPIVDGCTVNPNLWYTDDYTGPLCFFWSFGDGTTSTDENATHTYTASGTYTICLTVSCCDDPTGASSITVCQEVTVNCDCPQPCELYPAFNALMDPITVETGCCMQFYNNSMAGPHTTITGYLWDFGDGATSTDTNPFHCFLNGPGAYTVCLTVFGSSPEGECAQTFCFTFNCDCEDTCPEDVNHDGYIGVSDLLQVLGKFQQQCP